MTKLDSPQRSEPAHAHGHAHPHTHGHSHDHTHPGPPHPGPPHPGPGHNHSHEGTDHLHSHLHGQSDKERAEELKVLATSFLEGFRAAEDKTSYLRLAGIPFQREGADGLTMCLVDAAIVANWQIGTASPAFASRELLYMPFPGKMIASRESMTFTYVSLTERADIDLVAMLAERIETSLQGDTHDH